MDPSKILVTKNNSHAAMFSPKTIPKQVEKPAGYKGLHGFHKYWGKKPLEPLSFLIEHLCPPNSVVVDPFLGGGLLTRICRATNRRFVGIDINPISTELGKLFLNLPSVDAYINAVDTLSVEVRPIIDSSYARSDGSIGTHFLWNKSKISSVWTLEGRIRLAHKATVHEQEMSEKYSGYIPKNLREITTFSNSRINATPELSLSDIFKARALMNIDLLVSRILKFDKAIIRRALLLTLTAASGQMSNFVFAISKRGKKTNRVDANAKTEVGSWAIGLWRPEKHFEINVWNCFKNRSQKLLKALKTTPHNIEGVWVEDIDQFFKEDAACALITQPAQNVLQNAPDSSIDLILADPPHNDRIPYLELSEFWNSFIQSPPPDFDNEIVISNARERSKKADVYAQEMSDFMRTCTRILKPSGFLCLLYNCVKNSGWDFLRNPFGLSFVGCFNLNYSASSIAQDNRNGAMKSDFALVYRRTKETPYPDILASLSGWSQEFPQ